jgi:hypothetical protein
MILSHLSDDELVAVVARLARGEREATASLVAHLAELYGRRLHERAGYSSLFTYCTDILRFSDGEAYDRMRAAKVVHRYPAVLRLLSSGQVNLTTIRLLAPHLTRRNHEELFAAACGMRKRQVQELLARRFPKPDVPFSVRRLPDRDVAARAAPTVVPTAPATGPTTVVTTAVPALSSATDIPDRVAIPPVPPALVQPLAPERYRITFTVSTETRETLECAQDLLRHAVPSGDAAEIVGRALRLLVEDLVKQKYAVTCRPRASGTLVDDSRYIPAEVKRRVHVRDRGRCAFIGSDGHRCGERAFIEFHHVIPYAMGGRATVENSQLRCRAHNGYEAAVVYGPIKRYAAGEAVKEQTAVYGCVMPDAFRSGTKTTDGSPRMNRRTPVL